MSLIQDALKRQQEEFGDGKKSGQGPTMPPPLPSGGNTAPTEMPLPPQSMGSEDAALAAAQPDAAQKSGPRALLRVGLLILVVVLVGGGAAMWFFNNKSAPVSVSTKTKVSVKPAASAPAAVKPAEPVAVAANPEEPPKSQPPAADALVTTPQVETIAKPPAVPAVDVATPSAGPTVDKATDKKPTVAQKPDESKPVDPVQQPEAAAVVVTPPPAPAPADWPLLKVTAVLSGVRGGGDAARINNKLVPVGGDIEGVTLTKVDSEGVWLKLGDQTKHLKMGASIY